MKQFAFILLGVLLSFAGYAQKPADYEKASYKVVKDLSYTLSGDPYAKERCKLDIYYSEELSDRPVVVWFHGGGLTQGNKDFPWLMKQKGIVLVAVNYRLLPNVTVDSTLDDAAAAIAWTFKNIQRFGGNPHEIFVSGHSAGGYITAMEGLDKKYLAHYGIDADSIMGLVPFSGQMISHFSYRQMKGIGPLQAIVDPYAPLYHVRKDAPPIVLITGDREMELFGRYEENAYMWRMLKLVGHPDVRFYEIGGHNHGDMGNPAQHILYQFILEKTKHQ